MRAALPVLAAALLAWGAGASASRGLSIAAFPPPAEIRVPRDGAAGDMVGMALGARRLMADVWFIRLMQYYGTPELREGESEDSEEVHERDINSAGKYPDFLARARHVLEIDPGFTMAALYGAGSLAFNMNRPDEAEALLNFGLLYRPREWKYLTLLTAIGYSKASNPSEVAAAITPLLKDPDCPVMLKQLAAFLNKKAGNFAQAAAIYADIAATSRDAAYVANARRELERLSRKS
jgi:hypothetical protein